MFGINDRNRRWWILGATAGVLGLTVLDETIVGVALPDIRAELGLSQVASHWVVNVYLLTFTCFVAIGGRLGDSLGHHGFFIAGAALFGLASLAGGLAPAGGWLIAARAIQGIGAAIIFPAALAMTTDAFAVEQRGLALGIQTTVAAIFMSLGPLVGGLVTEALSWRWIFWINLPVVLAVAAAVFAARGSAPARSSSAAPPGPPRRIDWGGTVTLVAGLSAVVTALMQGTEWGWAAPRTLALFAGGLSALGLFTAIETRTARPLIEIGLLRIPTFTGGNLVFFAFQFNKMVVFVFMALYLQHALHRSPAMAGLAVCIGVLPTLVTSLWAGKVADRYGSRLPLMVALLVNGTALLAMGIATAFARYDVMVGLLAIWGAALPFLAVPARRALMSAVPAAQRGQAGGLNLTLQMLGGTVGIAVGGALLATTNDYGSLFLLTGGLTVATVPAVWLLLERPSTPDARRV
jgi:EmrB/QacA subfamily drug resistance transporter